MKSFKTAILDAFGLTALSSLLHRIENDLDATKKMLLEQDLRAAAWHAAVINRQMKVEQSVRCIEISLSRITKQLDALVLDDDRRLLNASAQRTGSGQGPKQVRGGGQEKI